jgi:hypothetical protein
MVNEDVRQKEQRSLARQVKAMREEKDILI